MRANVFHFSLRFEQIDGDVAEGGVAQIVRHMREAAAGEVGLAVPQNKMRFRFVEDGVDDVGRAERDEKVIVVVLMELGHVVRRYFDVVNADVFVFDFQMMMRLAGRISVRERHRLRGLGEE